jgi:hypothetical protein
MQTIGAWSDGAYRVEMRDEPAYSFGSADNARTYAVEYLLEQQYRPSSVHGLVCVEGDHAQGSALIGAGGGATCVREHSKEGPCDLVDAKSHTLVFENVAFWRRCVELNADQVMGSGAAPG